MVQSLTEEHGKDGNKNLFSQIQIHKPKQSSLLPIFILSLVNYKAMLNQILDVINKNSVTTQALANGVVKAKVDTPDNYRN